MNFLEKFKNMQARRVCSFLYSREGWLSLYLFFFGREDRVKFAWATCMTAAVVQASPVEPRVRARKDISVVLLTGKFFAEMAPSIYFV